MSPVYKFSSYGKFKTMAMGNVKPDAPTIGTATDVGTGRAYNNGAATVTFTAPPSNSSNFPITSYTVTSSPGGFTATGASSPLIVTGLQSSTSYTFTVIATNAAGNSPASAASNSITATTIPQVPTIGTATGGNGSATVAYTANATGGKTVTYTATSSPGSFTGTGASPITVSGLTNGSSYTFTVTASNANGSSAASSSSNSVTLAIPSITMEYLIVGGGGSGSNGGGGGGQVRSGTTTWLSGNTFSVTVGSQQNSSAYAGLTAAAGGNGVAGQGNGSNGASGGGAGTTSTSTFTGGIGSAGGNGGNTSGSGFSFNGGTYAAGMGGGGAGGSAGNGWSGSGATDSRTSGDGIASSITGTLIYYAGGGAGGQYTGSGTVGLGGTARGVAAAANTGAGGGGGSGSGTANGGSGVVIIAYPDSNPPLSSIPMGLSYDQPTRSGYRVYRFTSGIGTVTV